MNSSENEKKNEAGITEIAPEPAGAEKPIANFLNKYLITILVGSITALLVFSVGFGIGSISTRIHDGHYGERSGWMHSTEGPGGGMSGKFFGGTMRDHKQERLMERRHNMRSQAMEDRAGNMHIGAACDRMNKENRMHKEMW